MMKTRKRLVSILAIAVVLSTAMLPVSAAGSFNPGTQEDKVVTGPNATDQEIPVYGYVGDDAIIEDTDPEDPAVAPDPDTSESTSINVTAPIKILWAAFSSNNGSVTSPNYYIKNNSAVVDLKVSLMSFAPKSTAANTAVDTNLDLDLTGTEMNVGDLLSLADSVTYSGVFQAGAQWSFGFDGTYSGSFATAYQPEYGMTLRFALA